MLGGRAVSLSWGTDIRVRCWGSWNLWIKVPEKGVAQRKSSRNLERPSYLWLDTTFTHWGALRSLAEKSYYSTVRSWEVLDCPRCGRQSLTLLCEGTLPNTEALHWEPARVGSRQRAALDPTKQSLEISFNGIPLICWSVKIQHSSQEEKYLDSWNWTISNVQHIINKMTRYLSPNSQKDVTRNSRWWVVVRVGGK